LRLVLEIDGWTHDSEKTRKKDARKDKVLEARGYKVIRFANEEIYGDIGKVFDTIKIVCEKRAKEIPHPVSLP